MPRLAIVVPCYKEESVLEETTNRLSDVLDDLINDNLVDTGSVILYVNDGSTDMTWPIISRLHGENKYVCGVNLARNVGHQNALVAGLEKACGFSDIVVTIDADLQDDVRVIRDMVENYHEGFDIVYGVRKGRKTDSVFKRWTALGFYKMMALMGVESVYNHADYRLMSKRAIEYLLQFPERNLFLRGMIPLIGYKTTSVYYDRAERFAGESKYPLGKMLNFAVDGITSFSVKPVRMVLAVGVIFVFIALAILVWTIYTKITGRAVSGWASMILSLWFVGGVIMIALGIVGEYIGKIYIEVKQRPRYNIESVLLHEEVR